MTGPTIDAQIAAVKHMAAKAPRMADCHPSRPHNANGLCRQCYWKMRRKSFSAAKLEEIREQDHRRHAAAYQRNREVRLEKQRRLRAESGGRISRELHLANRYGLTITEYDEMLAAQNGACAICLRPSRSPVRKRLYVDHDKVTGTVRGLLCPTCNTAIAEFDHSTAMLQRAIDYLESAEKTASSLAEQIRIVRIIARQSRDPNLRAALATLERVKREERQGRASIAAISEAVRRTR